MRGYTDLNAAERLARLIDNATTRECMLHLIAECRASRKADRTLRAQLAASVFRKDEPLLIGGDSKLKYELYNPSGSAYGESALAALAVRAADAILAAVDTEPARHDPRTVEAIAAWLDGKDDTLSVKQIRTALRNGTWAPAAESAT